MDKSSIPYLLIFALISILGILPGNLWGYILTGISVALLIFTVFFFRDPSRKIPDDTGIVVSPADGVIVNIDEVEYDNIPNGKRIAIFMSPLNVHINRSPVAGKVIDIKHYPGCFKKAFLPEASIVNERIELLIETERGPVLVKQIAGIIARRIVCRAKVGDMLSTGQKFGLIHFGSRVEIVLPFDVNIPISHNQRVVAGETVIARFTQ